MSGGLKLLLSLLTDTKFLSQGDSSLMRQAAITMLSLSSCHDQSHVLFRAALIPVVKVLKLLLVSQGFAFIITVSQEIKHSSSPIYGDRHKVACLVQDAVNMILPSAEQRMKSCATVLAKNLTQKASDCLWCPDLYHTDLSIWWCYHNEYNVQIIKCVVRYKLCTCLVKWEKPEARTMFPVAVCYWCACVLFSTALISCSGPAAGADSSDAHLVQCCGWSVAACQS